MEFVCLYPVVCVYDLSRALVPWPLLLGLLPLLLLGGRAPAAVGLALALLQLLLLLLELGDLGLCLGDLPVHLGDLLQEVVLGGLEVVPLAHGPGHLWAGRGDLLNLRVVPGFLRKKEKRKIRMRSVY